MNDGIKILLARIKTHPEEFIYNPSKDANKWSKLLNSFRHCFTAEEINAIDEGIRDIERARFTELVMTELLNPHEYTQRELDFRTSGNVTLSTSQILPSSNTTIAVDPLIKKHPTKFGRLYNHEHSND